MALSREKRRNRMYELLSQHPESVAELRGRVHRSRVREAMPHKADYEGPTGGKIAWKYVSPRVARMYQRKEINGKQLQAAAQYVYLYRLDFMLKAPGTNFPKGEKIMSSMVARAPWAGKRFPLHNMLKVELDVLEAALIFEASFKQLPASIGASRITRHRTGRAAFLSALSAFHRALSPLLTN